MGSKTTSRHTPFQKLAIASAVTILTLLVISTASPAQTLTTLAVANKKDGANPQAAPVQGPDGNFYGTSSSDGANGDGTVYRLTPAGDARAIYNFCSQPRCADGNEPSQLSLATDGNFYGTTEYGGNANNAGTVFKITPSGVFTTLYTFCSLANCTDGTTPYGGVIQATDGNFYGTTSHGGNVNTPNGTVFKLTPTGELTTLYTFCAQSSCPTGAGPMGHLIQATDGNFYGTTIEGGSPFSAGTIFKITPAGTLTTVYSFCTEGDCLDGESPFAPLLQGTNGSLYGVTADGGSASGGTAFRLSPGGVFTTLYSFCSLANCADGDIPVGLIQASDGNFYGTTAYGGNPNCGPYGNSCGSAFELTPDGTLFTLYDFCSQADCSDGGYPAAGLVQSTNGNFYGTTFYGGNTSCFEHVGCGTVFSLSTGIGPFLAFIRASGRVGWKAEILGQGFTGTTAVSFNGMPATFDVVADTFLTATVPAGATTGPVTVTTPGGTLNSNVSFRVLP
jgi:uncharacterized repeat protein (TIGR03803 family)